MTTMITAFPLPATAGSTAATAGFMPALASRAAFPAAPDLVSSDFSALASHMQACNRSRGRFFTLRSSLEMLHATTAPRIVTTGTVLLLVGGISLLAFA